jgi:hypothetical protein
MLHDMFLPSAIVQVYRYCGVWIPLLPPRVRRDHIISSWSATVGNLVLQFVSPFSYRKFKQKWDLFPIYWTGVIRPNLPEPWIMRRCIVASNWYSKEFLKTRDDRELYTAQPKLNRDNVGNLRFVLLNHKLNSVTQKCRSLFSRTFQGPWLVIG